MWQKAKSFGILALSFYLLLLSPGLFCGLNVNAQENPNGNIDFQPNIIDSVNIHFVEEFFRFQWFENRFDLKLLIGYNDTSEVKELSLKDFWEKTEHAMKWKEVLNRAEAVEFGYNITDIPQEYADNCLYLLWKIEEASFSIGEIRIEEIETPDYNLTRFHFPGNLALDYEDLYEYGFTVSHPSKLETKIENVKGKTSWNLDPIVFSGGVITITGYSTEGTAANHDDIYNAMLNSTFQKTDNQYYSNARIVVGNGVNPTYFVDSEVQVSFNSSCFSANYQIAYEVKTNSHLRFGVLTHAGDKIGKWGVDVYVEATGYLLGISMIYGQSGEVLLYSCHFRFYNPTWTAYGGRIGCKENTRIWDCLLDHVEIWIFTGSTVDIYECVFTTKSGVNVYGGTPTIDRISIYDSGTSTAGKALCFYLSYAGNIENPYVRGTGALNPLYAQSITVDHNLINPDLDKWSIYWTGTNTGELYRQYTLNLNVTLPDGTPYEWANVTVQHYGESASQDFTVHTASNGGITEQTLNMGFYNQTGDDTLYDYNPYHISITNVTGYNDYSGNFTLEEALDLTIIMQESSANWIGLTLLVGLLGVVACVYALTSKN